MPARSQSRPVSGSSLSLTLASSTIHNSCTGSTFLHVSTYSLIKVDIYQYILNHPIVKYAQEELQLHTLMDAAEWAGYPKGQQLATVRGQYPPSGQDFAAGIEWAVDHQGASDEALLDVVAEYVRNPVAMRTDQTLNGELWYYQLKNFKALWRLVPRTPLRTAYEWVMQLPAETAHGDEVPEDVLDWLHGGCLCSFLYRRDVGLRGFRQ
jgi:hypothetical protein